MNNLETHRERFYEKKDTHTQTKIAQKKIAAAKYSHEKKRSFIMFFILKKKWLIKIHNFARS
jgi:hypothetical protein